MWREPDRNENKAPVFSVPTDDITDRSDKDVGQQFVPELFEHYVVQRRVKRTICWADIWGNNSASI